MAITQQLSPLQYLIRYQAGKQLGWAWNERQDFYDLANAYYNNSAYKAVQDGGYRDYLLAEYGLDVAAKVEGFYNPVQRVVDLYRYVFAGTFTGKNPSIRAIPGKTNKIVDPLKQLWAWSNLNIEKRALTNGAANLGTVGIRIVARNLPSKRVYLSFEHPKKIKDIELDDRGNVERVLLEYQRLEGDLGEPRELHTITELLTATEFSTWRDGEKWDLINNRKNGELWRYPNALGVCPYVLLRHVYTGDDWGLPAWHGQAGPIDALNVLASHIDEQIRRHVRVKWLVTAAGKAPKNIDMGDTTVAYVQLDPTSGQAPTMQALVAPLSLADAIAAVDQKLDALRDAMPELKATDGKFLAGQSGETIAQLRLPAEELILDARANYEDALIRANKIGLSWMIRLGMIDLGTDTGSQRAAQAAYEEGYEEHEFEERAALPDDHFTQLAKEAKELDNRNKLYQGIETLSRAGAISLEQMVRDARPDWSEQQVKAEVKQIEDANKVSSPDEGSEGNADPLAGLMGKLAATGQQEEEPEEIEV